MRQVAELYKRQVKPDKEVGTRVKLMIKNYRLHCIKDEANELNPAVRKLSNLSKGTSIYVSNSLIKGEIFHYGTSVTDKLS
jgi:hypothetical protein